MKNFDLRQIRPTYGRDFLLFMLPGALITRFAMGDDPYRAAGVLMALVLAVLVFLVEHVIDLDNWRRKHVDFGWDVVYPDGESFFSVVVTAGLLFMVSLALSAGAADVFRCLYGEEGSCSAMLLWPGLMTLCYIYLAYKLSDTRQSITAQRARFRSDMKKD